ncbi:MAG: peptidoglycan DD-metalloendopeptidase family protein [Holosporaceae bacterium]|jgi:septal ring factor EnvC (AmiA/AmiB activator)|nr:peptidoglycan DD-metalloendopeptidase family protein [Holosporaceae bacterium]
MSCFFRVIPAFFLAAAFFGATDARAAVQSAEMRELCRKARVLEAKINKLNIEVESINQKEKASVPLIRSVYGILARCFTMLTDMQRFSALLILSHRDNKNDFVRCSIIIKNFASYFRSVGSGLEEVREEISKLRKSKQKSSDELKEKIAEYAKLAEEIEIKSAKFAEMRGDNSIQNDVVFHLATKSESLEELDAELEAENAIGVLKNTKISTKLSLACPVSGKIVTEFGDKGENDEMIYHLAFSTSPGAVVTSPAKGLVVFAGKFLNYGNILIISNGEYRVFLYGMDNVFPSPGDMIDIGDYVGRMRKEGEGDPVIKMELKKSGEPLDPRYWLFDSIGQKEEKR